MRGMFAAISGLKTHQVMLDVTANDIANVNTIGYKSARTTFKDSLTQLQRGASGAGRRQRRRERRPGRPRHPARLDRQPDAVGALQSTGNPSTSRSRARVLPRRRRAPRRPARRPRTRRAVRVHPRGQLHHQQRRLPGDPGRLLRPGPNGRRRRHAAADPGRRRRTWRSARTARSATSTARAARVVGRLHLAGHVPRTPPASSAPARNRWTAVGELGHADHRHPGRATSASRPPARSRCPTWTSPRRSRT